MLTSECVNTLPDVSQGLHFITENLPRQHSDSDLSCRTTIRSVACESHRREWPPFRWKMEEWCWQAARPSDIIWVMRLYYKDEEIGTASTRDTHMHSSVDIRTGLKIDQVTIKFATTTWAKVTAASVSATASSTEAEEQRVQVIKLEYKVISSSGNPIL